MRVAVATSTVRFPTSTASARPRMMRACLRALFKGTATLRASIAPTATSGSNGW